MEKHDDVEFFEGERKEQLVEELLDELDDDDMVELLEGKKVKGVKLDKHLRREVKHMIKRGEDVSIAEILGREGVILNNQKVTQG